MDKIKLKVDQVILGEYPCLCGEADGKRCSFVIAKDVDISKLEGKTVTIVRNENGEFVLEVKEVKEFKG